MIKSIRLWLCVIGVGFTTLASAGGPEAPNGSGLYFSLLGGANWVTSGTTAAVNLGGLDTNLYVANSSTAKVGPIVGADIGYHFAWAPSGFWMNVGVEGSYTQITSPRGIVHPLFFLDPTIDTLSFNYEAEAMPLFGLLTLGYAWDWVELYGLGGAGVSWNIAYNYNEIPTDPNGTALPMRTMFSAATQTSFAWTAGAGIAVATSVSTRFGLEYRYTNYGGLFLNPAAGQVSNQALSLGTLKSNAVLARLTVMFTS